MKKSELLKALEIVKPGLSNNDMLEQTTSFAFIDGFVVTYNDDISIRHPVNNLEITGAIKAEELYKLLGKLRKDEIEVEQNGSEIRLSAGKSKAGLCLQDSITLPIGELNIHEDWKELPKDFTAAVKHTMSSCSNDMSKPNLTCVHIRPDGYVEASDGFRISRFKMKEKMPCENVLIPSRNAAQIIKLKPINFIVDDGWMHFQNYDGTIISTRVFFNEKFPDLSNHIKMEDSVELIFPKTIGDILDRASVFAKRDHVTDEEVIITIHKNKIKIRGESETGWLEESANMKYKGDEITFKITPYLFKDILHQTQSCHINKTKVKFTGDNWIYLAMLRYS